MIGGRRTRTQSWTRIADGTYVPQFAIRTGSGGLTAFTGGDRWQWEHRVFDGVYDGALEIVDSPSGPAAHKATSRSVTWPVIRAPAHLGGRRIGLLLRV